MYRYDKYYIPGRMMGGIRRYVQYGIIPGDFLQAVISNNLVEAVKKADYGNIDNLPAYASYLHEEVPSNIWGSKEIMLKYSKDKQGEIEQKRKELEEEGI